MNYFVYILRDSSNKLYIGQTNNLPTRLHLHTLKSQKSAKFVKDGGDFKLEYQESYSARLLAMKREKQLKGWSRAKKESLISNNLAELKRLSKKNRD
ncbi:hypothetical protein A3D80_01485 [Candidatus Roizmanbacteria bacterium RIFCSPHIGHO2_02_FULL_40_13b]|uniref:GIY-YIG domain-containing protein n=1 Tax=Candidatus Roizmanbacteria bacterium RIFCSPHIGHO2_01_FULL_39_24 TaxID=1802032 RepID=A0A1F7GK16_9BACT|nr:MAG: hypothetical protein A2799_00760 [Candidatus Roizmanbacteria bacterium RIFCSPHIGHO2_01_FULL_39_24]OGK26127.1 MAG: hypothetical protein A3D80_01485 [Candidatus Roizmanbacteria bacterium RIFCSPHIGHO2_02_FULL_40_13b]OGK49474.1 MAG: hypothetical protein A3A56_00400 [Candidatus Roizmanbacteria bacterium RIFCSPLOWO2_01_FULL_40_32]OGK57238.1 MAG: hypothetical protein A3H83_03900 [Candidatus Roizmanbacteria bacterium RIFCSPLOWO2_02_FULL_39_8]